MAVTNRGDLEVQKFDSTNDVVRVKVTPYNSIGSELGTLANPTAVQFPGTYFDCFGRFSVASPHKLFENGATYPIDLTRYHSTSTTGAATITRNATKTQIELVTTNASGDKAIYQSRRNIQYNKANSQEIFTIYKPTPTANRRERWGYFNESNGVFFEHDGTNPRLVIRSDTSGSVVDTKIEQADWDDPLDGTGASGLTIDWSKQTVFKIDFGWLSSRGVRFFIDVEGTIVLVKQWYISNSLEVGFMATATLPVRFEVENTAATSGTVTSAITCHAVQSSGSAEQEGPIRTISNGLTATTVNTTDAVIGGIRLNTNYVDRASLQPLKIGILPATGTDNLRFKAVYNPTLANATWTTSSDGVYDYLTATMPTATSGSIIAETVLSLGAKNAVTNATFRDVLNDVYIGGGIGGTQDALVLMAQTDAGSGTVFYNAEFKEFT